MSLKQFSSGLLSFYNKPNMFCRICGDKAFSKNYGVLTCSSCKVFFRRHSLHLQVCRFD